MARPRQPESLPRRLDRRRIYVLPTRFGLFVALLLVTPALARSERMVGLSVVAGVLALVALLDALRSRGRPLEHPTSPIGREASGDPVDEA